MGKTTVIHGIVRNGVVSPVEGETLPAGERAVIITPPTRIPADLQAEFDEWGAVSEEAWSLINEWEGAEGK